MFRNIEEIDNNKTIHCMLIKSLLHICLFKSDICAVRSHDPLKYVDMFEKRIRLSEPIRLFDLYLLLSAIATRDKTRNGRK